MITKWTLDNAKLKKYIFLNMPYILVFIVSWYVSSQFTNITYNDAFIGLVVTRAVRLYVFVKGMNNKKYRKNIEYRSAR